MSSYLNEGLPVPQASADGLDAPFWNGLAEQRLLLQRCADCGRWQWGPEWICHRCLSDAVVFEEIEPRGTIYSYERVWHPVHPALERQGPYIVVLVKIDGADVRIVGNLLGPPEQPVVIGAPVVGVFEHHRESDPPYSLLQWESVR